VWLSREADLWVEPGVAFHVRTRGTIARSQVLNVQMGLVQERFDQNLGAWSTDFCTSESNQRQFYRYWAKLMGAKKAAALEPRAVVQ
jgi:hypothetical protein